MMFEILISTVLNFTGVTRHEDEQMWEGLASNIKLFLSDAIVPYRSASFSFYVRKAIKIYAR